jgi:hypothetical protein
MRTDTITPMITATTMIMATATITGTIMTMITRRRRNDRA